MADDLDPGDWVPGAQLAAESPGAIPSPGAGAHQSDATEWSHSLAPEEDEERTHRKRGPKRGKVSNLPKRQRLASDRELEEHVAYSVGLDAWGMNEHESGLLADDTDEEAYYKVTSRSSRIQQMQNPVVQTIGTALIANLLHSKDHL